MGLTVCEHENSTIPWFNQEILLIFAESIHKALFLVEVASIRNTG
jgi:hypothetical protein